MHVKPLLFWIIATAWTGKRVQASAGDRDLGFRSCVTHCEMTGCISTSQQATNHCNVACPEQNGMHVPLALQAFQWTCKDDCRYWCMMDHKQHSMGGLGNQHVKFYGKWPFRRVLGMQELLSVIFSLANMAVHIHRLNSLVQAWRSDAAASNNAHKLYWMLWTLYAICAINSWFCSAVFHSRDTYTTERFDYLSADLTIFVGLYVSVVCTLGQINITKTLLCALPVLMAFATLCQHMLFVKFDYGFNVLVCVVAGVVQHLLWCYWALYQQHPGRKVFLVFAVLINAALGLEIFDFPPIAELLDAHALWHMCTVPLTYLWYAFVFCDAAWRFQLTGKQQSAVKSL